MTASILGDTPKRVRTSHRRVWSTEHFFFFLSHFYFPASGQAVVTGAVPSPPRFLPSIFIAHRVQQSHCSSIFHRGLLTHALALSTSQFVHKKKSQRMYTSMRSAGFELTKLISTRLEDNLIRHRGDRLLCFGEADKAQVQGGVLLPRQFLQSSYYEHHVTRRALGSEPTLFLRQNIFAFAIVTQATRDTLPGCATTEMPR